MELILIILVVILIVISAIQLAAVFRKKPEDQSNLMIQSQINEMARVLDKKMSESTIMVQNQSDQSVKIIREITEELIKVNEGHKQVMNVTDQLKSLQDILKNPKQRGVLGEYYLETVLKNVLPPGSFQMQYEFKDGTIVDAVVITKDGIIPVDSKFSLENYNRILEAQTPAERERYENAFCGDLKMRIDETSKYIKPNEGTLEFAFMFIPSEAVYYDLLINKVGAIKSNTVDLIEYAAGNKKVMVVSPTTFLAYLQTVLQGLKALQIEESAKKIGKQIGELSKHISTHDSYMKKLGGHLGTSIGMYNKAYKELGKMDRDVFKIAEKSAGVEPMILDKPHAEEDEE